MLLNRPGMLPLHSLHPGSSPPGIYILQTPTGPPPPSASSDVCSGGLPATVFQLELQLTTPCPLGSFSLFHLAHHHTMHYRLVPCLLFVSPRFECKHSETKSLLLPPDISNVPSRAFNHMIPQSLYPLPPALPPHHHPDQVLPMVSPDNGRTSWPVALLLVISSSVHTQLAAQRPEGRRTSAHFSAQDLPGSSFSHIPRIPAYSTQAQALIQLWV